MRYQRSKQHSSPRLTFFHAQYDWTTGVPDNGNEWRKLRAAPRSYPLRSLVLCTLFHRGGNRSRVGMNGDTFSMKTPKECSKKFAATFQGKFLTRGNVLRIFFLFLEDFGAPL